MDTTTGPGPAERLAILRIALEAAQVDGRLDEHDLSRLGAWPARLREAGPDRSVGLDDLLRSQPNPDVRRMAFEAALGACSADRLRSGEETRYLAQLGRTLGLTLPQIAAPAATADALVTLPLAGSPTPDATHIEGEASILRAACACAALGWLAAPLATLAAIVVQSRLLQRIGRERGLDIDGAGARDDLLAGAARAVQYLELAAAYLEPGGATEAVAGSHAAARAAFAHAFATGTLALRDGLHAGSGTVSAVSAAAYRAALDEGARRFAQQAAAIEQAGRALDTARLPAFVRAH